MDPLVATLLEPDAKVDDERLGKVPELRPDPVDALVLLVDVEFVTYLENDAAVVCCQIVFQDAPISLQPISSKST